MFEKFISQIKSTTNAIGDVLTLRNNVDFNIRDQYSRITNYFSDTNSSLDFPPRSPISGASNVYLDLCVPNTYDDKLVENVSKTQTISYNRELDFRDYVIIYYIFI